jgi:hypothetical protein
MNGIIGFWVDVMVKAKEEGVINVMPEFNFKLTATELPKIRTGEKMKLPDFMSTRYKYNSRIVDNEIDLLKFLKEEEYKPFNK